MAGIPEIGLVGANFVGRAASMIGSNLGMFVGTFNPMRDALSRADPLMSYTWYVELPAAGFNAGGMPLPYYYVEEATLPFRSYETRTVFRNGNYRKYPQKYSVTDMSLTVYADADGVALRYLESWLNSPLVSFASATSETSGGLWVAPEGTVKRSIIAVILAPNYGKVAYLEYTGAWITSISELGQDASPSTRVTYKVNVSVDDVFVTVVATPSFGKF